MPNFDENIGFWDSVLIENLTEESFVANLYQRYKKGLIYVSDAVKRAERWIIVKRLCSLLFSRRTLEHFW